MSRLVLGVVGHVDHGKTALVGALTGMETDRLAEEKRRGISIALGFAYAAIAGVVVDFVDAPGHERFVRTLVGGVTGADAVLLVAAADEGIKPQTREHLTIAALLGVRDAVVAVSKCDRVSTAQAAEAAQAAAALAAELGLSVRGPVATSAVTGTGLDALRHEIAEIARGRAPPPDDGFAYLPLDRSFLIKGLGVVATGTLRRGPLRLETPVDLLPAGIPVRIRGLQVHGQPVAEAEPGQRVAVNLHGVERAQVPRGAVLVSQGALTPAEWLTVELRTAPDAPPLANGARLELLIGAAAAPARVRLLADDALGPGVTALAQLRLAAPVTAPAGDRFVLRTATPAATVAGGRVLDPAARRVRRNDPAWLRQLGRLSQAEGAARLELVLADAGARGVALPRLAQLVGLSPERAAAAAADLGARRLKGGTMAAGAAFISAQAQLVAALQRHDEPIPRLALAKLTPQVGAAVMDAALAVLAAGGRVRVEGGRVALVRAAQARARAHATEALARRFAEILKDGGLAPPELPADVRTAAGRQALEQLLRAGIVVRAFDRVQKRELLFHREAVERARRTLAPLFVPPGLSVSEVGQALGISRKYSVPLLEYLDGVHFTRRLGDRRVLAEAMRPLSPTAYGGD